MNNFTDIASENQRQWKSINALTAALESGDARLIDRAIINTQKATQWSEP